MLFNSSTVELKLKVPPTMKSNASEDLQASTSGLKSALRENISTGKFKGLRAKFKEAVSDVVKDGRSKRVERPTIVFVGEEGQKGKNLAYYDKNIYKTLKLRKSAEVFHNNHDATPRTLTENDIFDIEEEFLIDDEGKQLTDSLWDKLLDQFIHRKTFSGPLVGLKLEEVIPDMEEITNVEPTERVENVEILDYEAALKQIKDERMKHPNAKNPKHFIKLTLTETDDLVLFENVSLTAEKGTEEARAVEKYNADYEYLTRGPGRNRRTNDAEVQTENVLVKSRSANTERIKKQDQGSFVSNFEMYDTYESLAKKTKEVQLDDESHRKFEVTTYSREGENIDEILNASENFHLSSMILQRLLAGNVYRERQRRFRNMVESNPLDLNIRYLYRLQTLWTYKSVDTAGKNVVDMSWCPTNGDLLAIAYGTYYYRDSKNRANGAVLIWSIKNPVNPERRYRYKISVSSVEFSRKNPQLLAIALYDGTIEIIDVSNSNPNDTQMVIARSERLSSPGVEPVWQIQWIQLKEKEYIITGSQDGRVMKYEIGSGPYLVGYRQLRLDRIEGVVEALRVEHKKTFIEADRHPQILCLQKHPLNHDIYILGTDEGCLHFCSINFPHQHIGVLQVHSSSVYCIDFSPFSPKIFLTAGSDWVLRIWIEDIFEPVMELSDGFASIRAAYWSPIHSTILASCTQDSVQIWDIRRKNLKPASVRTFDNRKLTVVKFSPCGRSILVGDDEGNTHVCSLEDFPFPPHFQYDELEKALYKGLSNKKELEKQVRQMGHLGYSKEYMNQRM